MNFEFDASSIDTTDKYSILPKGDYSACAVAAEIKETKSRDGKFLEVKFQILAGEYKGRIIFDRFNFLNPSTEAENIGKQQLAKLCHAIGKATVTDTADLLDIPVLITIGITTRKDNGEDANRVVRYANLNPVASYTQQTQPQSSKLSTKPW